MEKSNVRLDTNSGNGKPEQQRKLDSTMEMGQSLEGSENKGSSYIETEGVIILDTFRGDSFQLIDSIKSLVELDIENALVPHGIGGLARSLLSSSAIRLEQLRQRVAELEMEAKQLRDLQYELMRSGALVAIEKCKNATGQRRVIDMYVSANQIAEDLLNAMDSGA